MAICVGCGDEVDHLSPDSTCTGCYNRALRTEDAQWGNTDERGQAVYIGQERTTLAPAADNVVSVVPGGGIVELGGRRYQLVEVQEPVDPAGPAPPVEPLPSVDTL